MRTPGEQGVGEAVHEVTERTKSLIRLEVELALVELRRKGATAGLGVGLLLTAALLGLYGIGFLFATAAAGLATALPVWLSILIVGAVLLALAGLTAALGISRLRSATPLMPEAAAREARLTADVIKERASHG
jgi:Putative Actinobacterial Holin-X, holin superfamily III